MTNLPTLRVARPTDDIEALLPFYRDGLGLDVLYRFADHDGFDGIMLGNQGAPYHFEFTKAHGHVVGEPRRKITFWSSTCPPSRNGRRQSTGWRLRAFRRFRRSMPIGISTDGPLKTLTVIGSSSKTQHGGPDDRRLFGVIVSITGCLPLGRRHSRLRPYYPNIRLSRRYGRPPPLRQEIPAGSDRSCRPNLPPPRRCG